MKATKVEVGQVRDVASGAEARNGVTRYARVVCVGIRFAIVESLNGKRRRQKDVDHLARCRLVLLNEVSP